MKNQIPSSKHSNIYKINNFMPRGLVVRVSDY